MSMALDQARRLMETGDLEGAEASLRRHLQRAATDVQAIRLVAIVLSTRGEADQAEFFASRAATLAPTDSDAVLLHANMLAASGKWPAALKAFRRAAELSATSWQAWSGIAHAAVECGESADHAAARAVALNPALASNIARSARLLRESGSARQSVDLLRRGLAVVPGDAALLRELVISTTYSDTATPQDVADACRRAGAAIARTNASAASARPAREDRRLRVGYLSSDLRTHSVAYFIEPILRHHDRNAFDVHVYFTGASDATTERLRSHSAKWVDAGQLTDAELAARVQTDGVDILIDLNGYSDGNRLAVLAMRPAPLQATYLGWPTSTGLPTVHARLVDSVTDPAEAASHSTESLARLDPCFLCYRPPDEAPAPEPRKPGTPLTFASFNAPFKVTDCTMDLWAAALMGAPGSRLLVKGAGLGQPALAARITSGMKRRGISLSRIEVRDRTGSKAEHLRQYSEVDVALDTFPYNGTTTTCEALWMGVPVVTRRGDTHASRVGASILTAVGLPELVAGSDAEFATIAANTMLDRPRLAQLRSELRTMMQRSPLMDAPGFVRRFEGALRTLWLSDAGT